jgi:catechol 2,3-dioxygenase-like lactoylglutathione lyase family enzyme
MSARYARGHASVTRTGEMSFVAEIGRNNVRSRPRTQANLKKGADLSNSLKNVGAITMFIDDVQRSKSFYEQVFDVQAIHEDDDSVAFRFENTIVNLLKTDAAPELIEPATVGERDAGSRFQLTIGVDDVDAACSELATKGVELLNGPMDREWGVRTASFTDPDGHIWEVAARLPE